MELSKKRKQKHQKVVDYENQLKKEILGRQGEEEEYWDEYEGFSLDSSSEKSDGNESSPDQLSLMGKRKR